MSKYRIRVEVTWFDDLESYAKYIIEIEAKNGDDAREKIFRLTAHRISSFNIEEVKEVIE